MSRLAALLIAASTANAAGPPGLPVVVAAPPSARTVTPSSTFAGRIKPAASVTLRARVNGAVEEVFVKEGQPVKKGDLLVRLDGRLLKAELARAEAVLARDEARAASAKADLARMKRLHMAKAVAAEEYERIRAAADEALAAVAVARADVELAKLKVEMTSIRAPFDGRAGRVPATPGGTAKAHDTPLVTVESVALVAAIDVDERSFLKTFAQMRRAKGGTTVELATTGGKTYKGRVSSLPERIDAKTGTARVHVPVSGEGLLPGQFVRVTVATGKTYTLLTTPVWPGFLGDTRILGLMDQAPLTVVDANGMIRHRRVRLLLRDPEVAENTIEGGLLSGDRILTDQRDGRVMGSGTPVIVVSP